MTLKSAPQSYQGAFSLVHHMKNGMIGSCAAGSYFSYLDMFAGIKLVNMLGRDLDMQSTGAEFRNFEDERLGLILGFLGFCHLVYNCRLRSI